MYSSPTASQYQYSTAGGSKKQPRAAGGGAGGGGGAYHNRGGTGPTERTSAATGSMSVEPPPPFPLQEPAIWATRPVEWPLPTKLPIAVYTKLLKASRAGGGGGGNTAMVGPKASSPMKQHQRTMSANTVTASSDTATLATATADDSKSEEGGGGGGMGNNYFAGFMNRVLNPTTTTSGSGHASKAHALDEADEMAQLAAAAAADPLASKLLRAPRPGCVAAANGWIVAVVECPTTSTVDQAKSSSSASTSSSSSPLRLVHRWNIRRGGSGAGSLLPHQAAADQWIALPAAASVAASVTGGTTTSTPAALEQSSRVRHVFVDPTGSHTLVSATNGELYYLHSSQRVAVKLTGFGSMVVDGSNRTSSSTNYTGIPASAVATTTAATTPGSATAVASSAAAAQIQLGLTPHSYVTAVAWDKERGTEGSTKTILLGTSAGELYEYSLGSGSNSNDDSANVTHQPPVLLHKLYRPEVDAPEVVGALVSGLYFERLRSGLLIVAATCGRHKRTRLYTYYSPHHSTSLRRVVAEEQYAALTELPGSVDFADLRWCNDHFGLRTETGVYYGTIDRSLSGPAVLSGVLSSSVIVDSGLLPYTTAASQGSGGATAVPVSLALTPHHIVTLSEHFEVRFINRVAQKLVQKERLDPAAALLSSTATAGSVGLDESAMGVGEFLMDIRRPDQIWLRKGRLLVHISSSQEDRDVWKYTLQKCLDWPVSDKRGGPKNSAATMTATPRGELSDEIKAQEALFERAKTMCTNASQKAVVTAVRAEYHLQQGRGELAARYLAQCPPSLEAFPDTAIRLALPKLGIDDPQSYGGSWKARASLEASNMALIAYLNDKMRIGSLNDEKMTCTMIGAWLTELYLHERGEQLTTAAVNELTGTKEVESSQRALLAQFLNSNGVGNMDAKTILKILTAHDVGAGECASYAVKSGDIITAVNAVLSVGLLDASGANEALRILNDAPFELAEPLYYKHASILLSRSPGAAGEHFLARYSQGLSPMRLLPSIMNYERTRAQKARLRKAYEASDAHERDGGVEESKRAIDCLGGPNESPDGFELKIEYGMNAVSFVDDASVAMNYLEGVVRQGCRNGAVFRYLMSLYIAMEDEEPLYEFLTTHVPGTSSVVDAAKKAVIAGDRYGNGDEASSTPLDMSYALRAVLGTGRHFRSAIKLYMGFGLRSQAVELALKVDPSLARQLAQGSVELEERKRLWLMIAKSAASDGTQSGRDVVSRVVSVLKDCGPEVLSIEDVLPFLPDFAQIDQIKDEICEALTSYASKIEGFLHEMNECDQTCAAVRDEIARLRKHHMRVKADARCAFTNKLVLRADEPFYAFPSGYVVLESALKSEVVLHLNERQRARLEELSNLLKAAGSPDKALALQAEYDGILAAECPLTGSIMIESIDRGFPLATNEFGDGRDRAVDRIDV